MSAGYDHLDIPEIKKRGIKVGYTPITSSCAVAEIAILLMLTIIKYSIKRCVIITNNRGNIQFGPQWLLGQDLRNATVGIFGLGSIGQTIVKQLSGFEVGRFIYTGHSRKKAGTYIKKENYFFFNLNVPYFHTYFIY